MKTQKILVVALYLSLGASAFAGNKLPSCSSGIDHATTGTVCVTEAGYEFKRYQNPATGALGWEDVGGQGHGGVGGKIWYDETRGKINAQEALNFCTSKQLDIPSVQDYRIATAHGAKEIFKDAFDQLFWTRDHEQNQIVVQVGNAGFLPTSRTQTSFITYPYLSRATISRELNVRCNGVSGVNSER